MDGNSVKKVNVRLLGWRVCTKDYLRYFARKYYVRFFCFLARSRYLLIFLRFFHFYSIVRCYSKINKMTTIINCKINCLGAIISKHVYLCIIKYVHIYIYIYKPLPPSCKRFYTFPKGIHLKVNVEVRREFELTNYDVKAQQASRSVEESFLMYLTLTHTHTHTHTHIHTLLSRMTGRSL